MCSETSHRLLWQEPNGISAERGAEYFDWWARRLPTKLSLNVTLPISAVNFIFFTFLMAIIYVFLFHTEQTVSESFVMITSLPRMWHFSSQFSAPDSYSNMPGKHLSKSEGEASAIRVHLVHADGTLTVGKPARGSTSVHRDPSMAKSHVFQVTLRPKDAFSLF